MMLPAFMKKGGVLAFFGAMLHMKDYVRTDSGIGFRPLGEGVVDLQTIIGEAPAAGVRWLCVEQDAPAPGTADRFEGPEISFRYLAE